MKQFCSGAFWYHYFTVTQILAAGSEAVWVFFSLYSVVTTVSDTSPQKAFLKYVKQKNPNEIPLFFFLFFFSF